MNKQLKSTPPPEDVLEAFVNEIKSPLTSLKGWIKILSIEADKDLHPRALESISTIVAKIEQMEEKVIDYLKEFKAGN